MHKETVPLKNWKYREIEPGKSSLWLVAIPAELSLPCIHPWLQSLSPNFTSLICFPNPRSECTRFNEGSPNRSFRYPIPVGDGPFYNGEFSNICSLEFFSLVGRELRALDRRARG
jgi:hypothetical protein